MQVALGKRSKPPASMPLLLTPLRPATAFAASGRTGALGSARFAATPLHSVCHQPGPAAAARVGLVMHHSQSSLRMVGCAGLPGQDRGTGLSGWVHHQHTLFPCQHPRAARAAHFPH